MRAATDGTWLHWIARGFVAWALNRGHRYEFADLRRWETVQWQRIKHFTPRNLGLLGSEAGRQNRHAGDKKQGQAKLEHFPHDEFLHQISLKNWQPGDPGVLRMNVTEETRTRRFAPLTFARFAFGSGSHPCANSVAHVETSENVRFRFSSGRSDWFYPNGSFRAVSGHSTWANVRSHRYRTFRSSQNA